jgi:hypothetical protein
MPDARELSHRVVELAESGQYDEALVQNLLDKNEPKAAG